MAEREITIEIGKPEVWIVLAFLAFVLFLELQVTFNSPIAFGDEAYHTRMAQYIAEEKEYPVWTPFEGSKLEREGFSRPPLWNILEGSFYFLFGFNDVIVKFLTPFIASLLLGLAVFLLAKRIYGGEVALMSAVIAVTIPSLVTYSVLFYDAALLVFYFALFIFTLVLAVKNNEKKYWIVSAVFAALAFLSKGSGIAIFPFLILVFVYLGMKEKNFIKIFKNFLPFVCVLLLLLTPFFVRNYVYYKTPDCRLSFFDLSGCKIDKYQGKLEFSGRTEQTGTEQSIFTIGLINYLQFAYGNLWFITFSFLAGLVIFFARKETSDVLILLMLAMVVIIVSQSYTRVEDTARASLAWVPFIALVSASFYKEAYYFIKKYQKYLAVLVFFFVIIYALFGLGFLDIVFGSGFKGYGIIDKLFGYDVVQNGQTTHVSGLGDVKQFSSSFFEACDWVKENVPKDALIMTVWGHHTAYNCQRNTFGNLADIVLSTDVSSMVNVAKEHGITHIFIQKFSLSNQQLQERYPVEFVQILEDNSNHFKKIYENGPTLQQCIQQGGCDGNIVYEIS